MRILELSIHSGKILSVGSADRGKDQSAVLDFSTDRPNLVHRVAEFHRTIATDPAKSRAKTCHPAPNAGRGDAAVCFRSNRKPNQPCRGG